MEMGIFNLFSKITTACKNKSQKFEIFSGHESIIFFEALFVKNWISKLFSRIIKFRIYVSKKTSVVLMFFL